MISRSSKGIICKPQFIRIFLPDLSEKMVCKLNFGYIILEVYREHWSFFYHIRVLLQRLPARFVKGYITKEWQNSQTAIIVSPLGKCWQFEFKNDQSGIFFTGRWSQFLDFHGISKGEVLLLRYERNMVSKFKAFGLNGCQKVFKNQNAEIQQSEK